MWEEGEICEVSHGSMYEVVLLLYDSACMPLWPACDWLHLGTVGYLDDELIQLAVLFLNSGQRMPCACTLLCCVYVHCSMFLLPESQVFGTFRSSCILFASEYQAVWHIVSTCIFTIPAAVPSQVLFVTGITLIWRVLLFYVCIPIDWDRPGCLQWGSVGIVLRLAMALERL